MCIGFVHADSSISNQQSSLIPVPWRMDNRQGKSFRDLSLGKPHSYITQRSRIKCRHKSRRVSSSYLYPKKSPYDHFQIVWRKVHICDADSRVGGWKRNISYKPCLGRSWTWSVGAGASRGFGSNLSRLRWVTRFKWIVTLIIIPRRVPPWKGSCLRICTFSTTAYVPRII